MNQLLAIKCFARVVETSSYTKAADSLEIPKATVSKLVRDLESHLGVRLLHRSTRRVAVTADGLAYYERTSQLLRELDDIDSAFAVAKNNPRGKIRVDINATAARCILMPYLPEFFAKFPDLQIELGVTDRSVDMIGENVDCAIRAGELHDPSFVSRVLGMASWTTCATPSYLSRYGTPKHPKDLLTGHHVIGYHLPNSGKVLPSRFIKGKEIYEIDKPHLITVNDGPTRAAAGLGGLGVLQTLTYSIRTHLDDGSLVPILKDWCPPKFPFHLVYPPNRGLSTRLRVFIDWLIPVFDRMK